MFSPNEAGILPRDDLEARKVMRLLFEGNATEEQAQIARAFILNLTGFYSTKPTERPAEAVLEARRIMATLIEYTRLEISEIDAVEQSSKEEPFVSEG